MEPIRKLGSPFLFDSVTGNIVGVVNENGRASLFTFQNENDDSGEMTPLTYTPTGGTLTAAPVATRIQPQNYEFGGVITNYSGKWASRIGVFQNSGVTAISLDDLQGLTSNLSFGTGVTAATYSFPALKWGTNQPVTSGNTAITTLDCPVLEYLESGINFSGLTSLTTFSLPSIIAIGQSSGNIIFSTSGMGAWTTFSMGAGLKHLGGNINVTSCAWNVASVNNVLARAVALDGTNGTTLYGAGRTITITGTSAAPTGQGITDKNALIARGVTVTTN